MMRIIWNNSVSKVVCGNGIYTGMRIDGEELILQTTITQSIQLQQTLPIDILYTQLNNHIFETSHQQTPCTTASFSLWPPLPPVLSLAL
jgi:hypothetical protein